MAMQRLPITLIGNLQLTTTAADTSYTAPANTTVTISAFTLNNTTGTPRTVTIHLIPSGGSATAANQLATTVTVPAAGSSPTIVSGLVGQHILPGGKLQMLAEAATAITPQVSGYATTGSP